MQGETYRSCLAKRPGVHLAPSPCYYAVSYALARASDEAAGTPAVAVDIQVLNAAASHRSLRY